MALTTFGQVAVGAFSSLGITDDATSTQLTITDTGVGVSVTPSVPLHVRGPSGGIARFDTDEAAGAPIVSWAQAGTQRSFIQHIDSGDMFKIASEFGGIRFDTGTGGSEVERVRIDSVGNVGIGETTLTAKLHLKQTAASNALFIDQDGNSNSINIDSEATTVPCFIINTPANTSGDIVNIAAANSLTTGSILNLASNSGDTGTRDLIKIINESSAATGTTCLSIRQDALNPAVSVDVGTLDTGFIDFKAVAGADAVSAISTLTTSGATTHHIQVEINGVKAWIAVSTTDPS